MHTPHPAARVLAARAFFLRPTKGRRRNVRGPLGRAFRFLDSTERARGFLLLLPLSLRSGGAPRNARRNRAHPTVEAIGGGGERRRLPSVVN
uniref:Uncharacterized protein n=1 Tax=Oryza meridionalis TaxID=40149 RepID=A0A0E0BZB1_9ORYZ